MLLSSKAQADDGRVLKDRGGAMRIPRFRFSVRRMMVAVAIVGTVLGGVAAAERRATYCHQMSRRYRNLVGCGTHFGIPSLDRKTDHDKAMARKYEDIAWRPWEPLPPGEPEPK
jgi:hypothetical protein